MRYNTAREVFETLPDISNDMVAVGQDIPVPDFIRSLSSSQTPEEAITFCAYALPARTSVWWGHECLVHMKDVLAPEDEQMLFLAAEWVRMVDEETRYAALRAGNGATPKTPGSWIALGAGLSGGSVSEPDLPPVPPPPHLTPRAVNAGVLLALSRVDPKLRPRYLSDCIEMGLQLIDNS